MLTTLRIKNLALVADLTLELRPGCNVITGETGAGKSIIIGALNQSMHTGGRVAVALTAVGLTASPFTIGTIAALYTVLVEGDDMNEIIADTVRGILDGHIVLSRKIAQRNHFPAIDVLSSASRVMRSVISPEHRDWAGRIREWMATYAQVEDLLNLGEYQRLTDEVGRLLKQARDLSGGSGSPTTTTTRPGTTSTTVGRTTASASR